MVDLPDPDRPVSQITAAYYFLHFLVILPWIARTERPAPLPNSITEAVLARMEREGRLAPSGTFPAA